MEQGLDSNGVAKLIRFIQDGAICPVEFWRAVESLVAPAELNELFGGLDAADQVLLRQLYHERPLAVRALEGRAFRGELRKWVVSGQARTPAEEASDFIFLRCE